jgi:DNA-directed RNA polymerase specialized sigma24 family protein
MENENSEVRPLLDRFDAVAREAGCRGVVVVHHTGHDKSRARGASSFGDWPTAMWTLERDGDKPSQFRARGRDVYVERSGLVYDQNTRQLSKLVGPDDADAEYFRLRRGEQLTTAQVADELAISKHTAKRRLEDAGWEITQEAQGTIPAVWEYPNTADDRWAPDPFA